MHSYRPLSTTTTRDVQLKQNPFLFTTAPAGMTVREGLRGQDCPWRSLAASAFDQISGRWSQRRRRGERESWVLAALVVCKSISGNTGALIVH